MGFAGTSLSEEQWAQIIVEEARSLGYKMTPRQVAEGLGVREAEGFTATGAHIGPWEEEVSFGSTEERLNARKSTQLALKRWKADGESWWPGWGDWEKAETEGAGPTRYAKFMSVATAALKKAPDAAAPAGAHPGLRAQLPTAETGFTSSGGLAGDAMHFGLVAVLALGGAAMVGLGVTRLFGAGGRA